MNARVTKVDDTEGITVQKDNEDGTTTTIKYPPVFLEALGSTYIRKVSKASVSTAAEDAKESMGEAPAAAEAQPAPAEFRPAAAEAEPAAQPVAQRAHEPVRAAQSGGTETFNVGDECEVLRSNGSWSPAHVTKIDPDGNVHVDIDGQGAQKEIPSAAIATLLRRRGPAVAEAAQPVAPPAVAPPVAPPAAPPAAQSGGAETFHVGAECEVLRTDGSWSPARVTEIDPDGTVHVNIDGHLDLKKGIPSASIASQLRRRVPAKAPVAPAAPVEPSTPVVTPRPFGGGGGFALHNGTTTTCTFVTPDLHGDLASLEMFKNMHATIAPECHMVFLGDYPDRGHHSYEVFNDVLQIVKEKNKPVRRIDQEVVERSRVVGVEVDRVEVDTR